MRLRILPSAIDDLDLGRLFYAQHAENLGVYFLDSLFADIDGLALSAGIHIRIWGFHRLLSRRFPYAIYYKIEGDVCTVWRVLDCRRRPSRLRQALSSDRAEK